MNLWDWVMRTAEEAREGGRPRLAELILRIPQWATDDAHAQLDAVMPEALALAREAKNPWLEVYFRHWNLQSRVLHRLEVTEWMGEATRLLDFAHSEAAKGCPQSVCVTQDFASCFGHADGPGYADERLAVARETLSRINPTWPCFTCISTEYAAALSDAGKPAEALAFVDAQEAALVAEGLGRLRHRFVSTRADSLLELGRPEEALALLRGPGEPPDENERKERALIEARALAALGRAAAAAAVLPDFDTLRDSPNLYRSWTDAVVTLAAARAVPNGGALERTLLEVEERLARSGAARKAFASAKDRARLALLRGARASALHACARMEALLPKLRKLLGADVELAETRARALALPEPEVALPASAAEVLDALEGDPEPGLDVLAAARAQWPADEGLALAEAAALAALGRDAEAEERLRAHLGRSPGALAVLDRLAALLLKRGRLEELREVARGLLARSGERAALVAARDYLARAAALEGQPDEARMQLRALLELEPDDARAVLELARLERESGEPEAGLARLDAWVARAAPGEADWERMVAGTLLGRWDAVRDSARRLGLPVAPGEGPLREEGWPLCRVRIVEPDGESSDLYAEQSGPVTARVLSIALPEHPQHVGDEVVFTLPPLNAPPSPGEEEHHTWLYPVAAVKHPGNYFVFTLDGAHPGDEAFELLRARLRAMGARVAVRSDERYQLSAPGEEEAVLPGLYALVAMPPDADLPLLEALLSAEARGWAHPLVWPGLLERLGWREQLDAQVAVMDRYGIKP